MSASSLRLELKPSPALAAAIVAAHGAASACLLLVASRAEGALLAILVLALGVAAACNRALLIGRRAPRVLELAAGEARLIRADGVQSPALAVRGIGVTRWWVLLRLGAPGRGGILISAGMLGREPFRRLRLWALWERVPSVAPGQLRA